MNVWASMILWDGADPGSDRIRREGTQERLTIAFVPTPEAAVTVALELVEEGATLIELCGGFGIEAGAAVERAVAGRAAVGTVGFGIGSIAQAAAYKARFDAG